MNKPRPAENILLVMADQLTAMALGCYGNGSVKTPHIDRLAEHGVVFDTAYSSSPLCAPARYALMSGQHISRCGGYDNAAYMPSTIPTFAHYLRLRGYRTVLCGKMHFIGADQLHGFEQRLTPDIYPPDFSWTPDWSKPHARFEHWYHNMSSVTQAGVAAITHQLAYDDEVGAQAVRALYDHARGTDARPLCMVVGFIHPHDPYAARRRDWDLYHDVEIALPTVPRLPPEQQDAHSKRLEKVIALDAVELSDTDILRARRAYYANVSYIDQWLGKLLNVLEECDLAAHTTIMFTSDHGDMLGERGLWYKMSFMEWSNRIPLILSRPHQFQPRRVAQAVSHVDILPTLLELAAENRVTHTQTLHGHDRESEIAPPSNLSGRSLIPLCAHSDAQDPDLAISEYLAEGTSEPMLMIRHGNYKFISCASDPDLLFDLQNDPHELHNLAALNDDAKHDADHDSHVAALQSFRRQAVQHWDAEQVKQQVLASQQQRHLVHAALSIGRQQSWEFEPSRDPDTALANSNLALTDFDILSRYPRPAEFKPRG